MSLGPLILPGDWKELPVPRQYRDMMGTPVSIYTRNDGQLRVIVTEEPHKETKWLHVSVSNEKRYPTWEEIRYVKDLFIGKDRDAVMILPEEKYYLNLHKNCFHLYHRLDGDTVPGNPQRTQ